jgi:photosystem II stability/assembly factor-like uncharacterized protein
VPGGLRWRLLGPMRAGWSTCATGVPGRPDLYYFGTADGGVWKTTDAGRTWSPIFDRVPASSIGALAVSASNPKVLYAGTGQVDARYDIMDGNGVYRSADGGATWSHAGLGDSRHIGAILVDPRDPDVVLVAALGHLFGPNAQRGVFRSADGGRSWTHALRVDTNTGAVDLAADAASPDVVFAATWQAGRHPWLDYHTPARGPGSGIHKSVDGGRTWTRLSGPGLPAGPLGRIGLAVAPGSRGTRVYATIDAGREARRETAADNESGLYRSDDSGATWKQVNADAGLASSYFSRITVDPADPDTVYVMGRGLARSSDGGRSVSFVRGAPGGDDFHFMWIDPEVPRRMILASDQGTIVSVNDGATWSSWYNQPTGQFYHLAADDRFPYWIYSSQQDCGTVAIASRSDFGQLTFRDWHPVGGEERDFCLPHPEDPETVFVSGLGGRLDRCDTRTGRVENVSPWPVSTYARRPGAAHYRYGWITPLAFSPVAPHALYQGAQVLFRTLDRGQTWETISPDLTGSATTPPGLDETGAPPDPKGCAGDVPTTRARRCGYGVIHAIAPSPLERDLVWVGTDNGLVHLTRDGGRTWSDVTLAGLADWSKVSIIDASATDPATAYMAVDRHRVDDRAPHVFRTHDHGRTWKEIVAGLPADAYAITVRQDPVEPRLLFLGTRNGVFVSFDDGDRWMPLQQNLPPGAVNDLLVHGNDLIAAMQGRALWVLDDLSPLRQIGRRPAGDTPYLFPPATAVRVRSNLNRDTPLPPEEPVTPNPPEGVAIDYDLGPAPAGPVTLEIVDAGGVTVRRFASDALPPALNMEERYFSDVWLEPARPLPAGPGMHRVHWDLRGERPAALEYEYGIAATVGAGSPALPRGMLVSPGRYTVRLTVGGRSLSRPLVVEPDPRVSAAPAELEARQALHREVARLLARAVAAAREIEAIGAGDARRAAADRFRGSTSRDSIEPIAGALASLASHLELADGPPTDPQRELVAVYGRRLESVLRRWREVTAKSH